MALKRELFIGLGGTGGKTIKHLFERMDEEEKQVAIERLNEMMLEAASQLDFEKAARLRDRMLELQGAAPMATNEKSRRARRKRR